MARGGVCASIDLAVIPSPHVASAPPHGSSVTSSDINSPTSWEARGWDGAG